MTSISITKARANLYQTVSDVNEYSQPITITNNRGKNAVLIAKEPFKNPPPYEGLVGNLEGFYSRRINLKHRLVYEVYDGKIKEDEIVYEGIVKVARMWSHYEEMR